MDGDGTPKPALEEIARHRFPVRIYFEDTDAGGIVYYANYLRYAERARAEMLRAGGLENRGLWEDEHRVFAVRRVEADYLAPAFLDDLLEVRSAITRWGGSSLTMEQSVWRHEALLVAMTVVLVCINEKGRAVRVPAGVREALSAFEAGVVSDRARTS